MLKWLVTRAPETEGSGLHEFQDELDSHSTAIHGIPGNSALHQQIQSHYHPPPQLAKQSLQNQTEPLYESKASVQSKIGSFQSRINTFNARLGSNQEKPVKRRAPMPNHDVSSERLVGNPHDHPNLLKQKEVVEVHSHPELTLKQKELMQNLPPSELALLAKNAKFRGAYVTDDPLATLSGKRTKGTLEEIYAVSRLNPLYQDDDPAGDSPSSEVIKKVHPPESPPTDHSSVRSSGYGSKENDSASDISERSVDHEDESDTESHSHRPEEHRDHVHSGEDQVKRHGELERKIENARKDVDGGKTSTSGDGFLPKADKNEIILNISNLTKRSTLPITTVAQIRRSFEDLSVRPNSSDEMIELAQDDTFVRSCQPVLYNKNPKYVDSVHVGLRRVRSLETVQEVKEDGDSPKKETLKDVPQPVWPKVSQLAETLQRHNERISRRRQSDSRRVQRSSSLDLRPRNQVIRFNPLVSVVTQNSRYVTAITVSPRKQPPRPRTVSDPATGEKITYFRGDGSPEDRLPSIEDMDTEEERLARYFSTGAHSSHLNVQASGEYPLMSLQPDSLVNEDTLRMMTYPGYTDSETEPSPIVPKSNRNEDLGQVMYSRGLYATLNRNAILQDHDMIRPPFKAKKEVNSKNLTSRRTTSNAKKRGLDTVRDLWEKTGLKTNGRKLLVDIDDVANERHETLSRRASSEYSDEIYANSINGQNTNETNTKARSHTGSCDGTYRSCSKGARPKVGQRNSNCSRCTDDRETPRSLSSMSIASLNKHRKHLGDSSNIYSSSAKDNHTYEDVLTNSSSGTSFENFGMDNFAFVDEYGHSSKATSIVKKKIPNQDHHYSSAQDEHEYSELNEVVVDIKKPNQQNSARTHGGSLGQTSKFPEREHSNRRTNDTSSNYQRKYGEEDGRQNSLSGQFINNIVSKLPGQAYRVDNERLRLVAAPGTTKRQQGRETPRVWTTSSNATLDRKQVPRTPSNSPSKTGTFTTSKNSNGSGSKSGTNRSGGSGAGATSPIAGPSRRYGSVSPPRLELSDEAGSSGIVVVRESVVKSGSPSGSGTSHKGVSHNPSGGIGNPTGSPQGINVPGVHNIGQGSSGVAGSSSPYNRPGLIPAAMNLLRGNSKQHLSKSQLNKAIYSRRLSPHPNSAALTCRLEGALCADFTLDGNGAAQQRKQSIAQKRHRKCCWWLLVFVALAVFIAVMVAVSWYITGGKRVFGSM